MERRILTVNAGSTSVRLAAFLAVPGAASPRELARDKLPARPGTERATLQELLGRTGFTPELVVHRVVHAGEVQQTCRFDGALRATVEHFAPLAPLHNPPTLAWADAGADCLPGATALAAFDSAFYSGLPAVAATYGLPAEISQRLGIRRLGFHGLAHRSMWSGYLAARASGDRAAPGTAKAPPTRAISLQLGGGCSATALRDGRPVETSMGFSPLEGLLMASRPGDLDAGALLHLMEMEGLGPAETRELLHRRCGLLGVSGISSDMRALLGSPAPEAGHAVDVYCHRIRKYLGGYFAVLGGCDAILVGGGAGEGSPELRRRLFSGLEALGIRLDPQANHVARAPARISSPESPVDLWVVPTDEERILAEEACQWALANPSSAAPDLHR